MRVQRSISQPIRQGLSRSDRWFGDDRGLIWCWERGRQKAKEAPDLAECALRGELPVLLWRGGVEKKLKDEKKEKLGSLQYLAMWQGLRGEDLDVTRDAEVELICSRTGQAVTFTSRLPGEADQEAEAQTGEGTWKTL